MRLTSHQEALRGANQVRAAGKRHSQAVVQHQRRHRRAQGVRACALSPSRHRPANWPGRPGAAVPEGVKRITTETGAGQWGSALSFACQAFGIECKVYMVKISFQQKPYRRVMME